MCELHSKQLARTFLRRIEWHIDCTEVGLSRQWQLVAVADGTWHLSTRIVRRWQVPRDPTRRQRSKSGWSYAWQCASRQNDLGLIACASVIERVECYASVSLPVHQSQTVGWFAGVSRVHRPSWNWITTICCSSPDDELNTWEGAQGFCR